MTLECVMEKCTVSQPCIEKAPHKQFMQFLTPKCPPAYLKGWHDLRIRRGGSLTIKFKAEISEDLPNDFYEVPSKWLLCSSVNHQLLHFDFFFLVSC